MKQSVHLICNAHIDPVWLWEWEEGAAETISTFRTAADFCENTGGFVFNQGEAALYRWIEEYDPGLFRRIQRLARHGAWHIMGGWHMQPDCNMPSGESFVRQILLGRVYFREKFDVEPRTAIGFDSFGHTRGLVQILARSGFDSYIHCRPLPNELELPAEEYIWEGYDGSRVMVMRSHGFYRTPRGKAAEKVREILRERKDVASLCILWGIGNHGGGPSRIDLREIGVEVRRHAKNTVMRHSRPEAFFAEMHNNRDALPVWREPLSPCCVGCYTSQARIKQRHRLLENRLYSVEKMAVAAWLTRGMEYPVSELAEASRNLAFAQFHDILPGSSMQSAEESSLRLMDHGLEILSRVRARAFFALAGGQRKAGDGTIPVFVYNPHPYPVPGMVECEFQLADDNLSGTFTTARVFSGGCELPSQIEKEASNLSVDWRKRVVFPAVLAPSSMNRFDCRLEVIPSKPKVELQATDGAIHFHSPDLEVIINTTTGLVDRCRTPDADLLAPGAFQPVVMHDDADAWGQFVRNFGKKEGAFTLMTPSQSASFSGVSQKALPPVRVIEDGPARTVVEAVFSYKHSMLCLRYKLPRQGAEWEIEAHVFWQEKDRMLKLSIPTNDTAAACMAQSAYGVDDHPCDGSERVMQKWVALLSDAKNAALTIINDGTHGFDCKEGKLHLSLLRSPAYSGLPFPPKPVVEQDRFTPRIDQGERVFRFWINTGALRGRLDSIDREALARNEQPMALSFFPGAARYKVPAGGFVTLSDDVAQLAALKKSERGDRMILRLFEPTGTPRETIVAIPSLRFRRKVPLKGFEIKTLRLDTRTGKCVETRLDEK